MKAADRKFRRRVLCAIAAKEAAGLIVFRSPTDDELAEFVRRLWALADAIVSGEPPETVEPIRNERKQWCDTDQES